MTYSDVQLEQMLSDDANAIARASLQVRLVPQSLMQLVTYQREIRFQRGNDWVEITVPIEELELIGLSCKEGAKGREFTTRYLGPAVRQLDGFDARREFNIAALKRELELRSTDYDTVQVTDC